jgi:hypothetical protein
MEGPAPFFPALPRETAASLHFVGHALVGFKSIAQPSREIVVDFEVFADDAGAQALLTAQADVQSRVTVNGGLMCEKATDQGFVDCQQRFGNVVIVVAPDSHASPTQQVDDAAAFLTLAQTHVTRVKATLG